MKRNRRVIAALLVTLLIACLLPATAFADYSTNVISSGTVVLHGTYLFNCETGVAGTSTGDIWWEQVDSTVRRMTPESPAMIHNLGIVDFNSISATQMDDYAYSSTPITGNNDSTNKLVNNDVFAVKTKLGHYTKVLVVAYGYNITIKWVTYQAPLANPSLVSPVSGQIFYQYPRNVTLSWKPVANANYYKVERQYLSGSTWTSYPAVTVSGLDNTSFTFQFAGDQKGRWRVTAYSDHSYSEASGWFGFSFADTKPYLAAPRLISPANNVDLYNYKRFTTLAWKPVPGAVAYLVEVQFKSGSTWAPRPSLTVNGATNSSCTIEFVGAQPGRWRVTALGGTSFKNSTPSGWWGFVYHN